MRARNEDLLAVTAAQVRCDDQSSCEQQATPRSPDFTDYQNLISREVSLHREIAPETDLKQNANSPRLAGGPLSISEITAMDVGRL